MQKNCDSRKIVIQSVDNFGPGAGDVLLSIEIGKRQQAGDFIIFPNKKKR